MFIEASRRFTKRLGYHMWDFVIFFGVHSIPGGGGGVLPYMGYIGMCRCEGYGFQAVFSSIGYINQSVWV